MSSNYILNYSLDVESQESLLNIDLKNFDEVYVNGDNNLGFKLIEEAFKRIMFNE